MQSRLACNHLRRLTVCAFVLLSSTATAQDIPDVRISVATQLKENGVLGTEINLLRLTCFEGDCTLTTLVLNRCISFGGDEVTQNPFSFTQSTSTGDLEVRVDGDVLYLDSVERDFGGETTTSYRFEVARDRFGRVIAPGVSSFSGAYIKRSEVAERVITVEFMPQQTAYSLMDLACPIELPGLVTTP